MAWVIPALKNSLWNLLQTLFALFKDLWMLSTGKPFGMSIQDGSHTGSAQKLSIWARYRMCPTQPASVANFLLVHDEWVDADYVLDDSVSLYYVTPQEAIFVESDPDINMMSSSKGQFFSLTQFYHAKKVIVMPIENFHRLADKIGDPSAKLIIISNTGRCGSTLLTQFLESTACSLSLNEPFSLTYLSTPQANLPKEQVADLCRSAVRMLCKPVNFRSACDQYIIKLSMPATQLVSLIVKAFPASKHLFMYRDGLPTCLSFARVTHVLPLMDMSAFWKKYSVSLSGFLKRLMGQRAGRFGIKTDSRIHFASVLWGAAIKMYRGLRKQGIDIAAVKYEDVVSDPAFALSQVCRHCDLPSRLTDDVIRRVMEGDSQAESPVGRERLMAVPEERLTERVRRLCAQTTQSMGVPDLEENCVLEGTVTREPTQ